jgi:hypothetical protein
MRVLLFHPWGRFDPAFCGASYTACVQLEHFQSRGCEVHCVLQEIPAWGLTASNTQAITSRFACVKSVRTIHLDCPPVPPRRYGDEFRQLLYTSERHARSSAFRAIANEQWDTFFTTDVTAAPYALALPRSVQKMLAVGDSYSRRAATTELSPSAVCEAETRFAFARIEAELYRVFDHVTFCCEEEMRRAKQYGVKSAACIPLQFPEVNSLAQSETEAEHDLLICGGSRSGELADAEWFYRHVYLPHLRAHGVRLTLAGPIAERFAVADLRVTKLPSATNVSARVIIAPAYEAAGPCVPVLMALAVGRTVVTSPHAVRGIEFPEGAAVVIDMRREPTRTANAIRALFVGVPALAGALASSA